MAADALLAEGHSVDLFDAMPSVGRKFLMAGKSGLNITHAEPFELFKSRFSRTGGAFEAALEAFTPTDVRNWAGRLGVETFIGTSGRVFPQEFKAAPLLRAWLRWMKMLGLNLHMRHRLVRFGKGGELLFETPAGVVRHHFACVVLAFGGASWPKLGSDGKWTGLFGESGESDVRIAPFRPANCGFKVSWSDHFTDHFEGEPVKPAALTVNGKRSEGEFVISRDGIEGSAVYTRSAELRDMIQRQGEAILHLDLAPDRDLARLTSDLARPRGKQSISNHLRKVARLSKVKIGLIRECTPASTMNDPAQLAAAIKALPVRLTETLPMDGAISCVGGLSLDDLDENYMLKNRPGVFVAGEMLDWEAPTGGYLLTACLAQGKAAGSGAAAWLERKFPAS